LLILSRSANSRYKHSAEGNKGCWNSEAPAEEPAEPPDAVLNYGASWFSSLYDPFFNHKVLPSLPFSKLELSAFGFFFTF